MEEPFIHQNRELPEIIIEGTAFIVDVAFAELRQKDNPENFYHSMIWIEGKICLPLHAQRAMPTWEETEGSFRVFIDQWSSLTLKALLKIWSGKGKLP